MHPDESRLNDYLDGVLDIAEQKSVRQHIEGCSTCALELEQLTSLKTSLADLPLDIHPDRDLRADIWQRIEQPSHARTVWSIRYPLAAAAVLLIAVTSVVTLLVVEENGSTDIGADYREPVQLASRDAGQIQRRYSQEVQELEMILQKSRGALAPETVRIMEENMRIIDRAINEAQTAIASDPNSDMLIDLLRSAYERKLELLRQAAKSSPVT